jgi:hypothetical protein
VSLCRTVARARLYEVSQDISQEAACHFSLALCGVIIPVAGLNMYAVKRNNSCGFARLHPVRVHTGHTRGDHTR